MADPNGQSAARLSEDIGDVLTAIRRLIAEDEALVAARDRLRGDGSASSEAILGEDAAEFLARRYGGNAALARRLVRVVEQSNASEEEAWPLGQLANGQDAARPLHAAKPRYDEEAAAPDVTAEIPQRAAVPQNDLVRTMSLLGGVPSASSATAPAVEPLMDAPQEIPAFLRNAPSPLQPVPKSVPPLRLEAARRAPPETGWRAWLRAEPRTVAEPDLPEVSTEAEAEVVAVMPEVVEPAPVDPIAEAMTPGQAFAAMVDDEDDFAEAFDWKARMRPEPIEAVKEEAEQISSPVLSTAPAYDPVVVPMIRAAAAEPHQADIPSVISAAIHDVAQVDDGVDAFATSTCADSPQPQVEHLAEVRIEPVQLAEPSAEQITDMVEDTAEIAVPAAPTENSIDPDPRGVPAAPAAAASTITGLSLEEEEKSIRELLREMIQEELHGELGQRFSRNLRAVIRREVAAAIDDQMDRF